MLTRFKHPAIFSDKSVRSYNIFSGLKITHFNELAEYFTQVTLQESAVITAGSSENIVFIILCEGRMTVNEVFDNSRDSESYSLHPGECAGAENLFDTTFSTLNCTANSDLKAITISRKNFDQLVETQEDFANRFCLNVLNLIANRIERFNKIFIDLYLEQLENPDKLNRRKSDS